MCKHNNGLCGVQLQGGSGAESWEWLILPTNIANLGPYKIINIVSQAIIMKS